MAKPISNRSTVQPSSRENQRGISEAAALTAFPVGLWCSVVDRKRELLRALNALNEAGVPYPLCGGMAVVLHGYPRLTA
jgi:hypothetical protein